MSNSKIKILIVDDEPVVRESLQDFLEEYEFRVMAVPSSEAALDVLAREHQDVLIVDLKLPGISGEMLILEAHKRYPEIKFIIHTGSGDYQLSDELRATGIHPEHIILKPVTELEALVNLITELFNDDG